MPVLPMITIEDLVMALADTEVVDTKAPAIAQAAIILEKDMAQVIVPAMTPAMTLDMIPSMEPAMAVVNIVTVDSKVKTLLYTKNTLCTQSIDLEIHLNPCFNFYSVCPCIFL